jgi:ATP-dependent exoDNAse (exonuclease V) alpha subunit
MTCDETFVLGDDGLYNELGYTGLSRGRDSNRLYAVTGAWETKPGDNDDPLAHLRSALSTSRAQTAATDITADANQLTRSHARSR